MYSVVGQTGSRNADRYARSFEKTARSFRALRADERAAIQESRLRVHRARDGESLEALAERTGSTWEPAQIAVANALEDGARLREGQLVKVAVPQPYAPRER